MSNIILKDLFPIAPSLYSVRIFFAKEQASDTIWHLCDAALGVSRGFGRAPKYKALHGHYLNFIAVRADTVIQADILKAPADAMCQRCLEEYMLAKDIIAKRRLLKFE